MKKFFLKVWANIKCSVGSHNYQYLCGNYHSRKDVFKCQNCGKEIEE
jgi:hypothetical protein